MVSFLGRNGMHSFGVGDQLQSAAAIINWANPFGMNATARFLVVARMRMEVT
jgi:hypothetical protein